ncbi:MAG: PrsW family intramembrane metalloprotease [Dehalococcoidia bacterium]|nr:PrsW family intramembrane metalloprotease [Dehalococcoidia bacterium]
MILEQSLTFFVNWFSNPNFAAIGLAVLIGIVWYAMYAPPVRGYAFIWAVAVVSALLTLLAIVIVQMPLQSLVGLLLGRAFDQGTLLKWIYVLGLPQILLSGFVQEAAKLVPVLFIWQRSERYLDPKVGLIVGAAAGLGFGVFEAMWAFNQMYAAGWSWATVEATGFAGFMGVWERIFAVGGHIAFSAIAGYGLARERGWLFYLIVALLHSAMNYTIVLLQAHLISATTLEILVAAVAIAAAGWALFLRHTGDRAPWAGGGYRKRLHLGKEPKEYITNK